MQIKARAEIAKRVMEGKVRLALKKEGPVKVNKPRVFIGISDEIRFTSYGLPPS